MERLNSQSNYISVLHINDCDQLVIRRSNVSMFSVDDVYIELITANARFLVFEDSYEYSAQIELLNAIKTIGEAPIGTCWYALGAPCNRGGLELWFVKSNAQNVMLQVIRELENENENNLVPNVLYSVSISLSALQKWGDSLIKLRFPLDSPATKESPPSL